MQVPLTLILRICRLEVCLGTKRGRLFCDRSESLLNVLSNLLLRHLYSSFFFLHSTLRLLLLKCLVFSHFKMYPYLNLGCTWRNLINIMQ